VKTEGGTTYNMQYTDPAHVHAPKVVNGQTYTYDANRQPANRRRAGAERLATAIECSIAI
jgi:hypothetical protein